MAFLLLSAGRTTTNEELEEMLEQGNPAVFTQGVSLMYHNFVNTKNFGDYDFWNLYWVNWKPYSKTDWQTLRSKIL